MSLRPHIVVIDPAVRKAETDCFNHLVGFSPLPLTYHLPALTGMKSLEREKENIKGFIIFGSESSVNDRLPWQAPLEAWLMEKLQKATPTLGFCYGHQMLAHMFGGKITFHSKDKSKHVGFREINLGTDPLWGEALVGKLYVRHNEIVSEAPESMSVVAKSSAVAVDGLKHKTLPIWSFQAHPEATSDFTGLPAEHGSATRAREGDFNFGYSLIKRFLEFCAKSR